MAGQDRPAGRSTDHVRGQPLEVSARIAVLAPGGEAAILEMAVAAALHPLQLGDSLVEFVVAHARHIEAQRVQRLDRRLVVEQPGQERAAADQVTGRHRVGVAGLLPQPVEGGRQVLRTAHRRGAGVELGPRVASVPPGGWR